MNHRIKIIISLSKRYEVKQITIHYVFRGPNLGTAEDLRLPFVPNIISGEMAKKLITASFFLNKGSIPNEAIVIPMLLIIKKPQLEAASSLDTNPREN